MMLKVDFLDSISMIFLVFKRSLMIFYGK